MLPSRTTQILHPRQAQVSNPFASKLGGNIAWPEDEPWPICQGEDHQLPLIPLLQLREDDFPDLWLPPGKQVLQVLWCPYSDSCSKPHYEAGEEHYSPVPKLYWRSYLELSESAIPNMECFRPDNFAVPFPCAFNIQTVKEFPEVHRLDRQLSVDVNNWIKQYGSWDLQTIGAVSNDFSPYEYSFAVCPLSKVGGYCCWLVEPIDMKCDHCKKDMRFLLSIASVEGFGMQESRWKPLDDVSDTSSIGSHELCIGDRMSLHIFVCTSCEQVPYKWCIEQ